VKARSLALFGLCLALAVLAALAIPGVRLHLLGAPLRHHLEPGTVETVRLVASLSQSDVIRGAAAQEEAAPLAFDVRMQMREEVKASGQEEVVTYHLSEVESRQVGTRGVQGLVGATLNVRLEPRGLPIGVQQISGQPSPHLERLFLSQAMAALWPHLPAGSARPGSSWQGSFSVPYTVPALGRASLLLQHRLSSRLVRFATEYGRPVAELHWSGRIVPEVQGQLPAGAELAGGGGWIRGTSVVDRPTGLTLRTDYEADLKVDLRWRDLPGAGPEGLVMSLARSARGRLWRPAVVPDDLGGFASPAASPAGP
jgi:hypothetical protein